MENTLGRSDGVVPLVDLAAEGGAPESFAKESVGTALRCLVQTLQDLTHDAPHPKVLEAYSASFRFVQMRIQLGKLDRDISETVLQALCQGWGWVGIPEKIVEIGCNQFVMKRDGSRTSISFPDPTRDEYRTNVDEGIWTLDDLDWAGSKE